MPDRLAPAATDRLARPLANPLAGPVTDRLARPVTDLRISVTDRCNFRCGYCMPREVFGPGYAFMAPGELLSFEEIERVVRAFAAHGVAKLRLTGGEPLLRPRLPELITRLSAIDGIQEVAMTTNGSLLARHADALAAAGLGRVTVSLDALDDATAAAVSGVRVGVARILAGLEAAQAAGLGPVKVNMVVRRGVNDHAVLAMAEHFRHSGQTLRFIEFMDVGATNGWELSEVLPSAEVHARIDARWPLEPLERTEPHEVARRYAYQDGAGEIGLISSVSQPFCGACSRARISADGQLFTCLFAAAGHDLRAVLRDGADPGALEDHVGRIWAGRADRYSERRSAAGAARAVGAPGPKVEMSYIGG